MASSAFGGTLTSGIQDISSLLPLLGTEQCEQHVGSGLSKGYLYPAATPLSLFGSLGLARAGFKTLLACFSVPELGIYGAKLLADAGFKPSGDNLALIMIDNAEKSSYLAETRLDALLQDLHMTAEKIELFKRSPSSLNWKWNRRMIVATALFSLLGIAPYVHFMILGSKLDLSIRCLYPSLRIVGSFCIATAIQMLLQLRVLDILNLRLEEVKNQVMSELTSGLTEQEKQASRTTALNAQQADKQDPFAPILDERVYCGMDDSVINISNSEADLRTGMLFSEGRQPNTAKERKNLINKSAAILKIVLLISLLFGVGASTVGYVGCFNIVQNAQTIWAPYIWLALEAALSVMRMVIWSINPTFDALEFIQLSISLEDAPPLSTCDKSTEEIEERGILPLCRPNDFLKDIVAYAGRINRWDHPHLSIYYTLTRRTSIPGSFPRTLYITVFDPSERTCRTIFRTTGPRMEWQLYSADPPVVDMRNDILVTNLREKIQDGGDPVLANINLKSALEIHYQSIMDQLEWRASKSAQGTTSQTDVSWTLHDKGHSSEPHTKNSIQWVAEVNDDFLDRPYFDFGQLQYKRDLLIQSRGKWIENFMTWVMESNDEHEIRRPQLHEKHPEFRNHLRDFMEVLFIVQRFWLEHQLLKAVVYWEEQNGRVLSPISTQNIRPFRIQRLLILRSDADDRLNRAREQHSVRFATNGKSISQERFKSVWAQCNDQIQSAWENAILCASKGEQMLALEEDEIDLFISYIPHQEDLHELLGSTTAHMSQSREDVVREVIRDQRMMLLDTVIKRCFSEFLGRPSRLKPLSDLDIDVYDSRDVSHLAWAHCSRFKIHVMDLKSQAVRDCIGRNTMLEWIVFDGIESDQHLNSVVDFLNGMVTSIERNITVAFSEHPVSNKGAPDITNSHVTSLLGDLSLRPGWTSLLDANRHSKTDQIRQRRSGSYVFVDRNIDAMEFSIVFWGPADEVYLLLVISFAGLPDISKAIEIEINDMTGSVRPSTVSKPIVIPIRNSAATLLDIEEKLHGLQKLESRGVAPKLMFTADTAQRLKVKIPKEYIDPEVRFLRLEGSPLDYRAPNALNIRR